MKEKHIEQLIKKLPIPTTRMDKRILSDCSTVLEQFKTKETAVKQPHLWRIIMKSRITKLTAAVIIIGAIVEINYFGGSRDGANLAFGQMKHAVEKMPWVHSVNKNSTCSDEGWLSFSQQIEINKKANGKITFDNYDKKIKYVYDPETETITLTDISHKKFALGASDLFSFIEVYLDKEIARGAELVSKNGLYNETAVEIWEITRSEGSWSEKIKIFNDLQSHLPLAVEVRSGNQDNESDYVGNITFDYPKNGPQDIYALSVPREAKIIDMLPQQDVRDILQTYQKYRSDAPPRYAAVEITNYEQAVIVEEGVFGIVSIIYKNDQQQYGEHYKLLTTADEYTDQMGDTFDSVQAWCRESELAQIDEIDLYTGVYHYQTRYNADEDKWDSRPRDGYSGSCLDIFQRLGWPGGLFSKPRNNLPCQRQIIKNQYSRKNGLICIEELCQGVNYGNRKKVMPPIRNLYYLNPQRNYLCERREHYRRRNALWQQDKSWLDGVDPNNVRPDVTSIKQITEYDCTDSGQWYPKFVSEDIDGFRGKFLMTNTIYLQIDAEFPEGIFDPENLPR